MKVTYKSFSDTMDMCDWLTKFCSKWNTNMIVGMIKDELSYKVFYKEYEEEDKLL
jgi:hypothetical protein